MSTNCAKTPDRIDVVSICSPNYLHASHIRFGLRADADVICEKPLVLDPSELDELKALEAETNRKVSTILQLRLHPAIQALRDKVAASDKRHAGRPHLHHLARALVSRLVERGGYQVRRRGDEYRRAFLRHAGLRVRAAQGPVGASARGRRAGGFLHYEKADVRWFLSVDRNDLPQAAKDTGKTTYRSHHHGWRRGRVLGRLHRSAHALL